MQQFKLEGSKLINRLGYHNLDNGFTNAYIMETSGVINLASYLFAHATDLASLIFPNKKDVLVSLYKYPMKIDKGTEVILTLNHIPAVNPDVKAYNLPIRGTASNPNDLTEHEFTDNILIYDMGSIKIDPKFHNFADYNGYTSIEVFLPFLGYVELAPNDVFQGDVSQYSNYLHFWLGVDYLSGGGTYYIVLQPQGGVSNSRILGTYNFQLGTQIPIGGTNFDETVRNLLIGTVKATVGVATSLAKPNVASTTSRTSTTQTKTYDIKGARKAKGARQKQLKSGNVTTQTDVTRTSTTDLTERNKIETIGEVFDSSANVLGLMHFNSSTDRANSTSLMWNTKPYIYIIIKTPKMQAVDADYNFLYGKPLGQVKTLSELHGYTEISNAHLDGVGFANATADEMDLLAAELSKGFILP